MSTRANPLGPAGRQPGRPGQASGGLPTTEALLRAHGLAGVAEEPFPNDGWSGASMTLLRRGGDRFVLKRDSLARDWIARATGDGPVLREAWFAAAGPDLGLPIRNPALGAAHDPATGESVVLMPDLTGALFDWNAVLPIEHLDAVLLALGGLHDVDASGLPTDAPWCPLRERVTLICRSALERPGPAHDAVASRLLPGWDLFDRHATSAARDVIGSLSSDPSPLVAALTAARRVLIHSDLKLANVGVAPDGAVDVVDWQMVMLGPVAIELGWFLVSNVNALPIRPEAVLERYWRIRGLGPGREDDLAILVGLLLRGWRKGYDAEAGIMLGSGVSAREDLAWWCERAVEAAARVL